LSDFQNAFTGELGSKSGVEVHVIKDPTTSPWYGGGAIRHLVKARVQKSP